MIEHSSRAYANNRKIDYSLALSMADQLGAKSYKKLVDHFRSAEEVFHADAYAIAATRAISYQLASNIIKKKEYLFAQAEQVVVAHKKRGIFIIPYESPSYPERLKNIPNPPPQLYTTRLSEMNKPRVVAIVGTRNATAYGKGLVKELVEALAAYDVAIVSGFAYGIDICAHREAVACNLTTFGVIAGGLDMIYPSSHIREISGIHAKEGALISEHSAGVKPERYLFPARNRIVAGMVDGVVIVEAGEKSGALITAKHANALHREVFALPGSIKNPYVAGCHYLIKTHQAHMITAAADLAYIMNWEARPSDREDQPSWPRVSQAEEALLSVLAAEGKLPMEIVANKTGIALEELLSLALQLEVKGLLKELPGNLYTLCP